MSKKRERCMFAALLPGQRFEAGSGSARRMYVKVRGVGGPFAVDAVTGKHEVFPPTAMVYPVDFSDEAPAGGWS